MIVLNGGSSSGKSGIARCLQDVLPGAWLTFGVDSLDAAMPAALREGDGGLDIRPDGSVGVGPEYRRLSDAWALGVAAMVRAGAHVVLDEVFLDGAGGQKRWLHALDGLDALWVGVRCDPDTAAGREAARGDRVPGMARAQAESVHLGVGYDMEVDSAAREPMACALLIAERYAQHVRGARGREA
ncbi:chloramphenicol phosphotransferase CPT [Streptomyces sp. ASQP_92]|uniref:chloramphenicol phosphotransferase CPT n=1 Tax=Streptomyces sp. ASQP_92 TaxID=2979116 RepID=UPI0021C02BBB|nr:chloramphenicol phosphotransferase CPT [Streptomyces sp. ASQP_92]MCT9090913.1 chloramphenicol phosphotransferase CPT [Streptomyces sp. ASQP_92]